MAVNTEPSGGADTAQGADLDAAAALDDFLDVDGSRRSSSSCRCGSMGTR
jgi:hypothetical protein